LATDNIGGHGTCTPTQPYNIYNYYCQGQVGFPSNQVELTLATPDHCKNNRDIGNLVCNSVEAFIDTMVPLPAPAGTIYPPVFYRCYWVNIPNTLPDDREIIQFEWSASSEYIEWYVNNIGNGIANSVDTLISSNPIGPGNVPTPIVGVLVPLLKVTNHSPSPF
jgi:hypothetical protein